MSDTTAPKTTDQPESLVQRLAAAMADAAEVTKSSRNKDQGYNYASAEAILAAVRRPLLERSILLLQQPRETVEREISFKKGGTGTLATVKLDFEFVDGLTGQKIVIEGWTGSGQDAGDKAIGKAYTNAIKTFIRGQWLLPTEDDPGQQQERDAVIDPVTQLLGTRPDAATTDAAKAALQSIIGADGMQEIGPRLAESLGGWRESAARIVIEVARELQRQREGGAPTSPQEPSGPAAASPPPQPPPADGPTTDDQPADSDVPTTEPATPAQRPLAGADDDIPF